MARDERSSDSLFVVVVTHEIDWVVPLAAGITSGHGWAGLAFAMLGFAVNVFHTRRITIGIQGRGGGVYAQVTKFWERQRRVQRIAVAHPRLRHWHTASSRGLELSGSGFSLIATMRGGRRLRPPAALQAGPANAPPVTFNPRGVMSNLPNIVLALGSLFIVAREPPTGPAVLTLILCVLSIIATLAASLRGAPSFSMSPCR